MTETRTLDEFRAKFRVRELMVSRNEAWTWSVRPAQPTLGAGVISLNRHALTLAEVSADEMSCLSSLVGQVEQATRESFDHSIMNYLMLMMVDHHVHYHVLPRYPSAREFAGRRWVDNGWPALPVVSDSQHADDPEMPDAIRRQLRSTLVND